MMPITPARDRGDGKPRCHNRPPIANHHHPGDADRGIPSSTWPARWVLMGCGSYADVQDVGKGPQPLPVREGWDCSGCRWRPEGKQNVEC